VTELYEEPVSIEPALFKRLSNAAVFPDGSFSIRIETDSGSADVRIPTSELGEIINFLIAAATLAAQDDEPCAEGMPPEAVQSPLSVRGLGLGYGRNPAESLLWIQLARNLALPFALDSKKLHELERGLSHTLKTMAADPNKVN
jgi:hypothetical protein